MKYLIYIALVVLPVVSFSQNKDTNAMSKKIATRCQVELAGKLSYGRNNTVKREEILADPTIRTAGCDNYTITSFEFVIGVNGGTYKRISNTDKLTDEMLDFIRQVKNGDPIIIQDVHYKLPNGQTGVMPGINLRIQK